MFGKFSTSEVAVAMAYVAKAASAAYGVYGCTAEGCTCVASADDAERVYALFGFRRMNDGYGTVRPQPRCRHHRRVAADNRKRERVL